MRGLFKGSRLFFRIALYGAILIFVILVMPKGIMGLLSSRKNAA